MNTYHLPKRSSREKRALFFPVVLLLLLTWVSQLHAQETDFKKSSLRTGIGVGFSEGKREVGTGFIYQFGWQKSLGDKDRVRINPGLLMGGFTPFGITDTRDQYFHITTLGLNLHVDLVKYRAISVVVTVGSFINYSRGLLGTGGWPENNNNRSEYFHTLYYGGNISAGLRIAPPKSRLAVELRPINVQAGSNRFILGYLMLGVDFRFKKG